MKKFRNQIGWLTLGSIVLLTSPARATEWYVATNGNGADGLSWGSAFTNVQDALSTAGSNDNVYLAAHTFLLPSQLIWTNSYVAIQGGYSGAGTPGTLDTQPTTLTPTGGAMRIMLVDGVTNGSLTRLTLTGGFTNQMGGGLCISNAVGLTLTSCTVSNNRAYLNGGGIWMGNSTNITLASCLIAGNTQQDVGTDWVSRYGGGLYAENSYGVLSNMTFRYNIASLVANNRMYGGGLSLINGGWLVTDSLFAFNRATASATARGGAIYVNGGTHTLRNALVIGNDGITGDGIQLDSGTLTLLQSTLYGNVGEGVRRTAGTLSISNSILWRNLSADVVGSATLGYVNTESGLSNGVNGCISADPLFENGFYLATGSACINTGSMTAVAAGMDARTTRTDGTLDTDKVDLGYHYPTGITIIPDLYVSESGLNSNDGQSLGMAFRTITKALSAATAGTRIHVGAGSYTNGVETFPLTMNKSGLQLLGANSTNTIINASGSNQRVLSVIETSGGRIEGLTLTGGNSGAAEGGGLYITLAGDLVISSCIITNNLANRSGAGVYLQNSANVNIADCIFSGNSLKLTDDWGTAYGGGLYGNNSRGIVERCALENNQTLPNAAGYHCATRGGGMAVVGGAWTVANCTISSNRTSSTMVAGSNKDARGAGLHVAGGTYTLRSCLLYSNNTVQGLNGAYGDGVNVDSGTLAVENCTLADNAGEGIRQFSGTVSITNSILWNNGDDVTGTVTLAYCDIEDGDSIGVSDCISANPAFTNGYQLQVGSPCVNAGTNLNWMQTALDLAGNARLYQRADMGAYETFIPLSVSNYPATDVSVLSATLNGTVTSTGRAPAHVWVYWGPTDGGTDRALWAHSNYFGVQATGDLSTNVLLAPPSGSYSYRFCATNADGEAWGDPRASFSLQEVWVSAPDSSANELGPDTGSFLISRTPTATNDEVVVALTLAGTATEGTDYQPIGVSVPIPAGASNVTITVTPIPDRTREPGGETVELTIAAGPYSIGAPDSAIVTVADWDAPSDLYVSSSGDSSYGTNWATAYTNLQGTLNIVQSNATIYLLSQTFVLPTQLLWTASDVTIQGGYAGDGAPGNPAGTPTVLRYAAGMDSRVLLMVGVTNSSLSGVTLTGGSTTQRGGGLCISNSTSVTLNACTLSNNTARLNGGGAYIVGSTNIAFVSCLLASNKQQDSVTGYVNRYGGGLYAENSYGVLSNTTVRYNVASPASDNYMNGGGLSLLNGGWILDSCVLAFNRVVANTFAQGGAMHIKGGSHLIRNTLVIGNEGLTGDGICLESGTLTLLHSTVYGNAGEGVRRLAGTMSISNSILWRNLRADVEGVATLGFVDSESGLSNGVNGCISADPLFENGFYLASGSPCINTGSMTAVAAGLGSLTTRADGTPDTGVVDLGYHYPPGITIIPDLYVSVAGANSSDGRSWGAAFRTITKALEVATAGTRIHIGAGTYANGLETFPLNLTQYGLQLLGTNSDTTIINAAGSGQRVANVTGATAGSRLEGLTFAGGISTESGGGLNISLATDLTLANCVITNNQSSVNGGGIYIQDCSQIRLESCVLASNVLAVSLDWGKEFGGALYAVNSKGTLTNCVIQNNRAYNAGGHSACRGGGLALGGGYWTVDACVVLSNRTTSSTSVDNGGQTSRGSGIYANTGTHIVRNTLLAGNDCTAGVAGTVGDGMLVENGLMDLQNCTLADNGGEGVRQVAGTVSLTNSILWNNGDDIVGTVTLAYCDIEDGDSVSVNGCISSDPLFEDSANGNYRLKPVSPCVNVGTNLPWMQNSMDLGGKQRIALPAVDMGAYEVQNPEGTVYFFR